MSKYNAKKTEIDGHKFDSKKEANYYLYLKALQDEGFISGLALQQRFELLSPFEKNGKKYRGITYVADFTYYDNVHERVMVVDVKGVKTDVYKLKKKMFESKYTDLYITEV